MKLKLFSVAILFCSLFTRAQTPQDYAVQITAAVLATPAQILLSWRDIPNATSYAIYKKTKTATSWGTAIVTLNAPINTYIDNSVTSGSSYEYKIQCSASNLTAYGYIYAGIDVAPLHNKGAMVLLVDSTFTDSCRLELYRLMKDLSGDGWQVIRHDVNRMLRDSIIREMIKSDYNANPSVKAVQIIGHVAVPYSGALAPDGHPDHVGAWPADVYYGNMSGKWTDVSVNSTSSPYPQNVNIPGDGKWDQSSQPTPNELQVSRFDFYNMPAFNKTEIQMMRGYLNRDHIYKMDSLTMNRRSLVADYFGSFNGEAFAASGWRNFAPLLGRDSIAATSSFIADMNTGAYQWAYATGPGSFTSAGGIGSTPDYAVNNVNGIFMMSFGSYFGDWNAQNDFMRAPMCSDVPVLTNCWAGRPHWFFHHMALGENIGYDARISQTNTIYPPGYGSSVHIALMGDLSLRTDYLNPPKNILISTSYHAGATINWTISADTTVTGYYIYRSDALFGNYTLISGKVTGTTFIDTNGTDGLKYYMVRATKQQLTPSGTYNNLSVGIADSATISFPPHTNQPISKGVLVVTEVSNGPSGDCEYVVMAVANCASNTSDTVNIQGWILDDNSGNFNTSRSCATNVGIAQGHYRLAYDSIWAKVAVGSVIVLYNHDATCYNLPTSIDGPNANGVYWQPVGGTVSAPYNNPHIERFGSKPSTSDCSYCAATGTTAYTAASAWTNTVGLSNDGDAFQVRCPGCTVSNAAAPSFYHGFGYGPATGNYAFQSIPATSGNLGGPVTNISSGTGKKFYFTGNTAADLGDPAKWITSVASSTDTIGILRNGLQTIISTHNITLPCCNSMSATAKYGKAIEDDNNTTLAVIKVYPNPASTVLNIEFPESSNVIIRLMDIAGHIIVQQEIRNESKAALNVSSFTPGMYIYQVITNDQVQQGKVFIQR